MMKPIFILIRWQQYLKNLFIFLPLFFVGQITQLDLLVNAIFAFLAFCLVASSVYILNDYKDIAQDKKHPQKKYRPLAAQTISKSHAVLLMIVLFVAGVLLMVSFSFASLPYLAIYIIINIAYCFGLKNIAVLDIFCIAIGFVLRLFVGSSATDTTLSMWIVIMTFLLALFIVLAKRRDDFLILLDTNSKVRKDIGSYNLQFIDAVMMITASVNIVCYILYTVSPSIIERLQSEYLYSTSFFVILGIIRYLQITFVEKNSSSPTQIVLKDRFMQITILLWLLSFGWIIYF